MMAVAAADLANLQTDLDRTSMPTRPLVRPSAAPQTDRIASQVRPQIDQTPSRRALD
jgi:hypothetical protein